MHEVGVKPRLSFVINRLARETPDGQIQGWNGEQISASRTKRLGVRWLFHSP